MSRSRRAIVGAIKRKHKVLGGGADTTVSAAASSFTSDDYDILANGTDDAVFTITARNAGGTPLADKTATISAEGIAVSAANSIVIATPSEIENDGVEEATVFVTVRDGSNRPIPNLPASDVVVAVSPATGVTITQPTTATDQNGQTTATFVSTNGATVTASATVRSTLITDTASVTVTGTPASVTPDLAINWFGVTNQATWEALSYISRENPYYTGYSSTTGVEVRTDGGPGGTTNYIRCHHPSGSSGNSSTGFRINLPITTEAENWCEFWVRLSTNFDTAGTGSDNPDYKFIFLACQPGDGRNELKIGNYGDMRYLDSRYNGGPDTLRITATDTIPTRSFRIRYHNKVGSSGTAISTVEFWDGVNPAQLLSQTGYSDAFSTMNYIKCGANRNKPSLTAQYVDWGLINIWIGGTGAGDPGWGF